MYAYCRADAGDSGAPYVRYQFVQLALQFFRIVFAYGVADTDFNGTRGRSLCHMARESPYHIAATDQEPAQAQLAFLAGVDNRRQVQCIGQRLDPEGQTAAAGCESQIIQHDVTCRDQGLFLDKVDGTLRVQAGFRTFGGQHRELALCERSIA